MVYGTKLDILIILIYFVGILGLVFSLADTPGLQGTSSSEDRDSAGGSLL